jgi:aromatic ring-opening dioxygenase LigB subunit
MPMFFDEWCKVSGVPNRWESTSPSDCPYGYRRAVERYTKEVVDAYVREPVDTIKRRQRMAKRQATKGGAK